MREMLTTAGGVQGSDLGKPRYRFPRSTQQFVLVETEIFTEQGAVAT